MPEVTGIIDAQHPKRTGLVVIDVQRGFEHPAWGNRNNPQAEAAVAQLIGEWRNSAMHLVHIRHSSLSPHGHFVEGSSGFLIKDEAKPLVGEPIYVKHANSAFIGTTLERDLRAAQVQHVVIVGLTTPHCVSTTARMAGNLGFTASVVSDATAAFEGRFVHGGQRSAQEVHDAALADLHGEFAQVVRTADVMSEIALLK